MKIQRFHRDALILGVTLLALEAFHVALMKDALVRQNRILAHRLEASVARLLNEAHRAKDDLAILQVARDLGQSPGIIRAYIVDVDNKIVADREPTRLGQTAHVPLNQPGVYSFALWDGAQRWGRLILEVSERFSRRWVRRQWGVAMGSMALVGLILGLYLRRLSKEFFSLRSQTAELKGVLQAERIKLQRSLEREQKSALQASACLQEAVRLIPDPMIFLDSQQRVSAINPAALTALGATNSETMLRKSWHEIPFLQSCGPFIEQSLLSPGILVHAQVASASLPAEFYTLGEASGTWIRIDPSIEKYEIKREKNGIF
jgi:PAS domain-containing protein